MVREHGGSTCYISVTIGNHFRGNVQEFCFTDDSVVASVHSGFRQCSGMWLYHGEFNRQKIRIHFNHNLSFLFK